MRLGWERQRLGLLAQRQEMGFGGKGSRIEGTKTILYPTRLFLFRSWEQGTWRSGTLSHFGCYGLGTHSGLFRAA
jgi:hypothetical protein